MNKTFWKSKLMPFLVPNEVLNKLGEHSYGVKKKLKLAFWFDGGLKVTGNEATLSLNLKDPDLLILGTLVRKTTRIYRIPYERLVCFELIRGSDDSESSPIHFLRN
jgi:hypothetical protein